MGWVNAAIQIGSALYNNRQAKKGADAQSQGYQNGINYVNGIYGDAKSNFSPYLGLGQAGATGLQSLLGGDYSGFYNSPDYKSARDAMTYGFDHSAASKGRVFSGGYQADLSGAQGNLANQYLGNYRNSLMGLASLGANSAGSLGTIGMNGAQMVTSAYKNIGDAKASKNGANIGLGNTIFGQLGDWLGQSGSPTTSSYAGGTNAGDYGLPNPVNPYQNTYWGS